jgi:hypothetical protein
MDPPEGLLLENYVTEGTYRGKVLDRLHVKSAAVLKYFPLNKPPSEELSDSEQSSYSAAESSDSKESSSSIESAASLVPRKVVSDLPLLVSHPLSTIMSMSPPFNGAASLVQVSCLIAS